MTRGTSGYKNEFNMETAVSRRCLLLHYKMKGDDAHDGSGDWAADPM